MPVLSASPSAVAAAILWPLAAGLLLVAWSRARAAERARRERVLTAELRSLYRTVEGRPVPERLAVVVEALEEAEAMAAEAAPPAPKSTRAGARVRSVV
jgi:hypothetical protein